MYIMWEFSTIKTDFLSDFNQTTHARPQDPIVFIHNISLYFKCTSSVKYVFKWLHHGHVMPFSALMTQVITLIKGMLSLEKSVYM